MACPRACARYNAAHLRFVLHLLMVLCIFLAITMSAFTLIYGCAVRVVPTTFMYVTLTAAVVGFLATYLDSRYSTPPSALADHVALFNSFNKSFVRFSGLSLSVTLAVNAAYIVQYGNTNSCDESMHGDARTDRMALWITCNVVALFGGLLSIVFMWALYDTALSLRRSGASGVAETELTRLVPERISGVGDAQDSSG